MEDKSPNEQGKNNNSLRGILLLAFFVPVILGLVYYGQYKSKESAVKSKECQDKCYKQGYAGYDFKWGMLSQPSCTCLAEGTEP